MKGHRDRFDVTRMCDLLDVSCSGFYAWLQRAESRRSQANRRLHERIREVHAASQHIYGAPRVHAAELLRESSGQCASGGRHISCATPWTPSVALKSHVLNIKGRSYWLRELEQAAADARG